MLKTLVILITLMCLQATTTLSEPHNNTKVTETSTNKSNQTEPGPESRRNARQLSPDGQEFIVRTNGKTKRQVIKIPSGVSKVKVFPHPPMPQNQNQNQNLRINNRNRQFKPKYIPHMRSGPPRRYKPNKRPDPEYDYEYEHEEAEYFTPKKTKKYSRKPNYIIKDVSPQEFYEDEDYQHLASTNIGFVHKNKPKRVPFMGKQPKKHGKKNQHEEYPEAFLAEEVEERPHRRPNFEEESGYEIIRPSRGHRDHVLHEPHGHAYHDDEGEDFAASSTYMKQVPAPNLAGQAPEVHTRPHEEPVLRRPHSTRQIQALFPQQYTTHNPHVTTNFGLPETFGHPQLDNRPFEFGTGVGRFEQSMSASEPHHSTVSVGGNGIHIVQPPNFREVNVSPSPLPSSPFASPSPSPSSNQRATIRDILHQDCPESEVTGFCPSPPRYPTQQINSIVNKCAELMESLYSPAPAEPEDDLSSFASRSDDSNDIFQMDDAGNNTFTSEDSNTQDVWSSWSRSSSENASPTPCESDLAVSEPGYAREVVSGRWFVVVQSPDSTIQKVTTDLCTRPGKSCSGLAGLKCSRPNGFRNGYKATRCIQRYTHHRLVSWDPESPHKCPKIRVFRFPTACLCHLGVI